jgi:hypothetical protein
MPSKVAKGLVLNGGHYSRVSRVWLDFNKVSSFKFQVPGQRLFVTWNLELETWNFLFLELRVRRGV